MASQDFSIGTGTKTDSEFFGVVVQTIRWQFNIAIDSALVDGGGEANAREVFIDVGNSQFLLQTGRGGETPSLGGPDLNSDFEAGGTITITDGTNTFEFTVGEDGVTADTSEPYTYTLSGTKLTEMTAFFTGYVAGATTLTIDDGAGLPLFLGTTEITKAYLGTTEITKIYKGATEL